MGARRRALVEDCFGSNVLFDDYLGNNAPFEDCLGSKALLDNYLGRMLRLEDDLDKIPPLVCTAIKPSLLLIGD